MNSDLSDVDKEIYACMNLESPKSFFLFAGAGSGKTGSLVKVLQKFRKENIHNLRINGQKVAIITYTNAACNEIQRRLEFDSAFSVSTIHSFCWEIIKSFQNDIRNWVNTNTRHELDELQIAQSKGRSGTKAAIDRERKIISKTKRLGSLNEIRNFTYSPTGVNSGRDSLNHSEVIKIASHFIDTKDLMQQILVNKYPILLIDESQDTKKELIEAIFEVEKKHTGKFCLGLFGDTMQRIYSDGKKDLGENLPDNWAKPQKTINYRCPKRVIKLINKIREKQPQTAGDKNHEGTIRLFIVNTTSENDKNEIEKKIANEMAGFSNDDRWLDENQIKILTLEHKMAAKRGKFLEFFSSLYDYNNTGLTDGTMSGIPFLTQQIIPLAKSILNNDEFAVAEIVKNHSPLMEKKSLVKSQLQIDQIQRAKKSVDELGLLWSNENSPLLIDVVQKAYDLDLFRIPNALLPIVQRSKEYLSAPDYDDDDRNLEIEAWDAALKDPFSQLEAYNEYISDRSRFGTHQGVKGLEFPRVMVVIDDNEANGFLFSYDKLLGAKNSSAQDMKNEMEGNDTSVERTRRLFYVTCSRAEKSLAIVVYTDDPEAVKTHSLSRNWFDSDEIIEIEI